MYLATMQSGLFRGRGNIPKYGEPITPRPNHNGRPLNAGMIITACSLRCASDGSSFAFRLIPPLKSTRVSTILALSGRCGGVCPLSLPDKAAEAPRPLPIFAVHFTDIQVAQVL